MPTWVPQGSGWSGATAKAYQDFAESVKRLLPTEEDFVKRAGERAMKSFAAAIRQRASTRVAMAGYSGMSRARYMSTLSVYKTDTGIAVSIGDGDPFVRAMEEGWAPPRSGDWEAGLGTYDGQKKDMRPMMGIGPGDSRVIPMTTFGTFTSIREKMVKYAQKGLGRPIGHVSSQNVSKAFSDPEKHPDPALYMAGMGAGEYRNFRMAVNKDGAPWAQDDPHLTNKLVSAVSYRAVEALRAGVAVQSAYAVTRRISLSAFSGDDRDTLSFAYTVQDDPEFQSDLSKRKKRRRTNVHRMTQGEMAVYLRTGVRPDNKLPQLKPAQPPRMPKAQLPVLYPHASSPFKGMHDMSGDDTSKHAQHATATAAALSSHTGKGVAAYRVFRTISNSVDDTDDSDRQHDSWFSAGFKPVGLLDSDEFERDIQVLLAETFKDTVKKR